MKNDFDFRLLITSLEEVNDLFVLLESLKEINKKISMYIFSWGSTSVYEDIFEDFENLTLKTIPQPILDIYKKIYRRQEYE